MSLLDKFSGKDELEMNQAQFEEVETIETPKLQEIDNSDSYLDEMGVIAANTVIHGDIRSKGHLAVIGVVEGDVKIAGNLMLQGEIKGTVECNNMVIDNSCQFNEILAHGSVSVKEGHTVNSKITCKHLSVLGAVNGNINACGNVGLSKNSTVRGNINAKVLAVEPGAKICGMVTVE